MFGIQKNVESIPPLEEAEAIAKPPGLYEPEQVLARIKFQQRSGRRNCLVTFSFLVFAVTCTSRGGISITVFLPNTPAV